MSQSTRGRGSGRRFGTVTVIEQRVHRSAAENARFAFILTVIVTGLVALVVAKGHMHPILAGFVAAPIATACGALVWTLVRIWPVLRLIWWWIPEIGLTVLAAWGWTALATATPGWLTLTILAVLVGAPAVVPILRRWVEALFWCVAVRHRLRVCFAQFIFANKSGSLPLILGSWPTPVGERVWVMLRPGLSLPYLTGQLDKIAVACHALPGGVLVEKAGTSSAAFVRFDIKRREVLTGKVGSPLVDHLPPKTVMGDKQPATVTGLDLPDITDHPRPTPAAGHHGARSATGHNGAKPSPGPTPAPAPANAAAVDGDDLEQWI